MGPFQRSVVAVETAKITAKETEGREAGAVAGGPAAAVAAGAAVGGGVLPAGSGAAAGGAQETGGAPGLAGESSRGSRSREMKSAARGRRGRSKSSRGQGKRWLLEGLPQGTTSAKRARAAAGEEEAKEVPPGPQVLLLRRTSLGDRQRVPPVLWRLCAPREHPCPSMGACRQIAMASCCLRAINCSHWDCSPCSSTCRQPHWGRCHSRISTRGCHSSTTATAFHSSLTVLCRCSQWEARFLHTQLGCILGILVACP